MLLGSETVKRVSPGVESYHRLANIGSTFQALSMKWTRKEKSTGHRPATRAEKSTLMRAKGFPSRTFGWIFAMPTTKTFISPGTRQRKTLNCFRGSYRHPQAK